MIRAASPNDLDAIATLIARRHARVQGATRELSPAFTDPAVVRGALADPPQGWVDVRDGELLASLLWEESEDGRAIAGVIGAVGSPEAMARLYAVAGDEWMARGLATHVFVVPSVDRPLADRLVDLSFGREEAYAVRPLGDRGGPKLSTGIEVDRVGLEELDTVTRLGDLLARHHEGSPVFDRHSNTFYSGLPDEYRRSVVEEDARVLIARSGEHSVGLLVWRPGAPFPLYDERSAEMILLAVHPDARGKQVGRSLVSTAMRDMASFGHTAAIADWRTTNLEASGFWPAQGFLTIANRYVRTVPERPTAG
ncbi:MAG: GNAT family N-acetyltransferase [Jiangellales bacterium]